MTDEKPEKPERIPVSWEEFLDSFRRPREEIFNPEQAAKFLGIHKTTLYKLIRTGQIPAKRIGNQYRIARSVLEKIVREPDTEE